MLGDGKEVIGRSPFRNMLDESRRRVLDEAYKKACNARIPHFVGKRRVWWTAQEEIFVKGIIVGAVITTIIHLIF